jgi:CRISPR-associated protein Csx14
MGGQAQVVTFVLDALLALGEVPTSVLVLHLSPEDPRVRRALMQLSTEFAGERYRGQPLEFRHLELRAQGAPLTAIQDADAAAAVWEMGRDLIARLKQEGHALHLCIVGGPRILALTLTSAAMLYCDHRDRLWHLYTPRDFLEQAREGAILHAPPEVGIELLPVPLMPWGSYFPALRQLSQPATTPALDLFDQTCCDAVWQHLTAKEQEVAEALAGGLSLQEAAERLSITLKTLDTHKTRILAECRIAWALPEDAHLTYHFLREKFGPYFKTHRPF